MMQTFAYHGFYLSKKIIQRSDIEWFVNCLSDIHLLKSSMGDKPKKPPMEQITDKMEELEVGQEQSIIINDSK